MIKRLCILGISLILSILVLSVGRLSGIDSELISVISGGIMAVGFVIYAVDAAIEFKNESHEYKNGEKEHRNFYEYVV